MHLDYLLLIFASVAATVWWLRFRATPKTISEVDAAGNSPISEHEFVRAQADFERRLTADCDLPDGIRGMEAYIYWNLMGKWFNKLIAEHRYDDEYMKKLRRDWCDYIELLPRAQTARFLAAEADDEAKASTYAQRADLASRSIKLIQDAFAAAVGADAVEELRGVRSREPNAFDRTGKRPMAPVGNRYFPVSINPYIEECRPIRSDRPTQL